MRRALTAKRLSTTIPAITLLLISITLTLTLTPSNTHATSNNTQYTFVQTVVECLDKNKKPCTSLAISIRIPQTINVYKEAEIPVKVNLTRLAGGGCDVTFANELDLIDKNSKAFIGAVTINNKLSYFEYDCYDDDIYAGNNYYGSKLTNLNATLVISWNGSVSKDIINVSPAIRLRVTDSSCYDSSTCTCEQRRYLDKPSVVYLVFREPTVTVPTATVYTTVTSTVTTSLTRSFIESVTLTRTVTSTTTTTSTASLVKTIYVGSVTTTATLTRTYVKTETATVTRTTTFTSALTSTSITYTYVTVTKPKFVYVPSKEVSFLLSIAFVAIGIAMFAYANRKFRG